ncbi:hypothetical protein Psuf_020990 [Phytohabitans suffuscus]|uniref:TniQ domain-containing protein n=1 Tax=Phytohabitans suffuscus TaxID=624315 RepID=A0A6F8YFB3_9ACTN|nr:hypothetical protein Psuf_020990 [Phytohabitans suffuscus]
MLPRRVSPVSGETLTSYLTRLATANHLTVSEILADPHPDPPARAARSGLPPPALDALPGLADPDIRHACL